MITARLFIIPDQQSTNEVLAHLEVLQASNPHQLVVIDVTKDADLMRKYGSTTPVLIIGPYVLKTNFTRQEIQVALGAAADRAGQVQRLDQEGWDRREQRGRTVSAGDRLMYWLSKHYLALFNFLLAFYVGLPFLAPAFMKLGWETPANVIYKVYSPLCHQFAFRSFFLFGEQAYYPRELAGIKGVIQYEQIAPDPLVNINFAREFVGNEVFGYKIALCERDLAIYGSLLLFGLFFGFTKRKIKKVHWLIYVIVGLLPIAIDGFSQIPGILGSQMPALFVLRESTPLLRVVTGTLFGILTGWFIYPLFEEAMRDTREFLSAKMAVAVQIQNEGG